MAKIKTTVFDAADYLTTPRARALYLTEALETGDAAFIAQAIGTIAKAQGMSKVARDAGLSRENLYRSLNGTTKTELDTVVRVLAALGIKLSADPKPRRKNRAKAEA